ncbi:porin [Pelomonas sp. APW6]|uniref:Porin n=1 Tax=Roseateles subflavus TaxID=3053353 RepID=A0ABT7LIH4_9BURK|nr:porin [Pelomonas sp. APW6]MDL5032661.1 porin [Pelomonas sp. APW6]
MKKATLVLGLLAASVSAAYAQSSVTLYGIVDGGVRITDNEGSAPSGQGSVTRVVGGGFSQSRLGVNVTEDLGGGMKVLANLEHRLNLDTGSANPAPLPFWMQSWVGLQSSDFGRVTIGRQYNVLFDLVTSTYVSYPYSPYFDVYKPEVGLALSARADNMVKYLFEQGPIRGELQVSAGEGGGGRTVGGVVRYSADGISVGAGMQDYMLPSSAKIKATTFGGSYKVGDWYVNAGWGENKVEGTPTAADATTIASTLLWASFNNGGTGYDAALGGAAGLLGLKKRTMWTLGLGYQMTPQLNLGTHFYSAKQTGALAALELKAKFWSAVADYALSKRTDLYAEIDRTSLTGDHASLNSAAGAPNGAKTRLGYTVGIRHRF